MIYAAIVLALLVVGAVVAFNKMIGLRRLTENAWADVDAYLKRRADLIPNLVEAVKGAAAYEKGTFERLAAARTAAQSAASPTVQRATAEMAIAAGLTQTIGLAEAYPQLKASDNFLRLQADLSDTERLIASSRQYYNACVRDYNILIESFPANLIAGPSGFRAKEFFEIEDPGERAAPGVQVT